MAKEQGFSLVEVLVAMLITGIVMAAVFLLLQRGQNTFNREPEVAEMNQSARAGLDRIGRDLAQAGYQTPAAMAVLWQDGGGIFPDQVTIVYADQDVPISRPLQCSGGGGPCGTIENSSVVNVDPTTFSPALYDASKGMDTEAEDRVEGAYADGMVLFAIETSDCNGDGQIGAVPFEVTQDPLVTSAGGSPTLNINHNPGQGVSDINLPGGFNGSVHQDCAVIGLFHVIQYRVNPPPPTRNPMLERRDLALNANWVAVSNNIENLQVQYAVGTSDIFVDAPATPLGDDPNTWITRVKVTVAGRSETTNLEGATQGVFAAEDTHLRNAFSTTVTLRNQAYNAQIFADENQHLGIVYNYN
jgi:prepilin-type N-terminal cleavage/methylation domain-containing protein